MSDPSARRALLHFAGRQRTKARGIAHPGLQGLPAPSLRVTSERDLVWELAGGDTTIDAGATQGGDADDVAEAVEGGLDVL